MKTIVSLLILLVSMSASGQQPVGAIELTELNVLYRGYANKVRVAVTNNDDCEVGLTGTDCVVEKSDRGYYIVKPLRAKTIYLTATLKKGDSVIPVYKMEYRVMNIPDPVLYWGSAKNGNKAVAQSRLLQAKYPPEIPLNAVFAINNWTFYTSKDTITGLGGNLSPIDSLVKRIDKPEDVHIKAVITGPDGIKRKINGTWSVDAWTDTEPAPIIMEDK